VTPPRRASTSANTWRRSSTSLSAELPPSRKTNIVRLHTVSENTKHVDLKWQFLKDHVEHNNVRLRYLPGDRMVADMFTKPLPLHALARHRSAIQ
jgi:hypothetical protein